MRIFEFIQGILLGLVAVQPTNFAFLSRGVTPQDSTFWYCRRWSQGLDDDEDERRISRLTDAAFLVSTRDVTLVVSSQADHTTRERTLGL